MKPNVSVEFRLANSFINVKLVSRPLNRKKLSTEKAPLVTIENENRLNICPASAVLSNST